MWVIWILLGVFLTLAWQNRYEIKDTLEELYLNFKGR